MKFLKAKIKSANVYGIKRRGILPCCEMAVIKINIPSNRRSWLRRFAYECWFSELSISLHNRRHHVCLSLLRDLVTGTFFLHSMTFRCSDLWLWLIIILLLYCFIVFVVVQLRGAKWFAFNFDDLLMIKCSSFVTSIVGMKECNYHHFNSWGILPSSPRWLKYSPFASPSNKLSVNVKMRPKIPKTIHTEPEKGTKRVMPIVAE